MLSSAEGVEEEAQLRRLTELRFAHAQGFLLARPVPAVELPAALARAHRSVRSPA